jgi:hypothetical protein
VRESPKFLPGDDVMAVEYGAHGEMVIWSAKIQHVDYDSPAYWEKDVPPRYYVAPGPDGLGERCIEERFIAYDIAGIEKIIGGLP